MEQWEKELRNKLELIITKGLHSIPQKQGPPLIVGKRGYIDFAVELERRLYHGKENTTINNTNRSN